MLLELVFNNNNGVCYDQYREDKGISLYIADKRMFVDSQYPPTTSRVSTVEMTEDLRN